MRRACASVLLLSAWLAFFGAWLALGTRSSSAQDVRGRVVVVVGRQVGLLNFGAPPPRILTTFTAPGFAQDVAAVPSSPLIAVSVATPCDSSNEVGGLRELSGVGADDASVCWSPDGSQLFVYGSTGARPVNAANGDEELLPFIAGFGATSWLP
jgi:hypothetical protein